MGARELEVRVSTPSGHVIIPRFQRRPAGLKEGLQLEAMFSQGFSRFSYLSP